MGGARLERDPLGEHAVPADAYYGIQTQRAAENFPISGLRAPDELVTATILVKKAAAEANMAAGQLPAEIGRAIMDAADEILAGKLRDQFIVDVYQAGAGTSHNMNANEVLANRAAEMLGAPKGVVHDRCIRTITSTCRSPPTTCSRRRRGSRCCSTTGRSSKALGHCRPRSSDKAREFAGILKVGRTHLQDAVPITLGEAFGGYAACIERGADDLDAASAQLTELNLGATAVGTGLNADPGYAEAAVNCLRSYTKLPLRRARNLFRVTQSMGDIAAYSGAMRRLSIELGKIASDLRLLSMGPRAGLSEIALPAVQPGSSIMPGKVNPSVPEMVNQVCYQVMGCDLTVAMACEAGQLELNVMMPVIAWNALHSSRILRESMTALANEDASKASPPTPTRARELLDRSTAVATALSPHIGYAATAEIAKESVRTGKSIRQIAKERGVLTDSELDRPACRRNG